MGCNAWNHPPSCDCGWGGDTGGGGGGGGFAIQDRPLPLGSGRWGRYEVARLDSYTIPNARCPMCGAKVFFYRSEYDGRVYFDPPLGPPWPKHPCMDNPSRTSRGRTGNRSSSASAKPTPSGGSLRNVQEEDLDTGPNDADVLDAMRRSGWHPLLSLKVRRVGRWQILEGFDPIEKHRCQIFTEGHFDECAPTFVRIDEPGRITCSVEQVQGRKSGNIHIAQSRGWFGVSSVVEARVAKAARAGDLEAMRHYAQSCTYRHLGQDNRISDVAKFVDLKAGLHWFKKAAKNGSEVAELEHAYLLDVIDHDVLLRRWRRANPNRPISSAPEAIRTPLVGTLAHAVCLRAAERLERLSALLSRRKQSGKDWMDDYYVRGMRPSEEYLEAVVKRTHAPRLRKAITAFLKKTSVPPFQA